MKNGTDLGRSVCLCKPVIKSLSLLLACAVMGAGFLVPANVRAEDAELLIPVSVKQDSAEPLTAVSVRHAAEPLTAMPVKPSYTLPSSYVNEYLGFSRSDLVAYLTEHAEEYLGTPYQQATKQPVPGRDGHMQCEGFIWAAMSAVATENTTDVPCGNIYTEPANGGGWVNWSYYHHVDPIVFNTKEEMLASGVLEKGDVIWSFDVSGPYGLSNANHVGFFWGDSSTDDKFWESAVKTDTEYFSGSADGNRIARIESMSRYPSVWWVFKLSPDDAFDESAWAGLPAYGKIDPEAVADEDGKVTELQETEETETPEDLCAAERTSSEQGSSDAKLTDGENTADTGVDRAEAKRTEPVSSASTSVVSDSSAGDPAVAASAVSTSASGGSADAEDTDNAPKTARTEPHETIFYNGDQEDTGYYVPAETTDTEFYYGY